MVVTTLAPAQAASWIAAWPTAPAPPVTRIVRPSSAPGPSRLGPSSWMVRARWAVIAGTPRLAPTSYDAEPGRRTACSAGTTVYSEAVPIGRSCCARRTQTRSPTETPETPLPTASTTPAPSCPGEISGNGNDDAVAPARNFQSVGFTPATPSLTRISPQCGS